MSMADVLSGRKPKVKKVTVIDLGKAKFALHRGELHKALGIKEGTKIPAAKLKEAMKSKDPHVRAMAHAAKGLESMKH